MFNKEEFKVKLEFFIKNYQMCIGHFYTRTNDAAILATIQSTLFNKGLIVLWQTRIRGEVNTGIDEPEKFLVFKQIISASFNSLLRNVKLVIDAQINEILQVTKIQQLINQYVETMATDIEELLNN